MTLLIQDCIAPFNSKVNFIDSNNVLVGYDMSQKCCERFGWKITEDLEGKDVILEDADAKQIILENYCFDPEFFEEREGSNDGGGVRIFKLLRHKKEPAYLHLFNDHNGCYSHGFTFSIPVKSEKI